MFAQPYAAALFEKKRKIHPNYCWCDAVRTLKESGRYVCSKGHVTDANHNAYGSTPSPSIQPGS